MSKLTACPTETLVALGRTACTTIVSGLALPAPAASHFQNGVPVWPGCSTLACRWLDESVNGPTWYGAATKPVTSVAGEPCWATSVTTVPIGNGATVLLIVFCAPPTCSRLPA